MRSQRKRYETERPAYLDATTRLSVRFSPRRRRWWHLRKPPAELVVACLHCGAVLHVLPAPWHRTEGGVRLSDLLDLAGTHWGQEHTG